MEGHKIHPLLRVANSPGHQGLLLRKSSLPSSFPRPLSPCLPLASTTRDGGEEASTSDNVLMNGDVLYIIFLFLDTSSLSVLSSVCKTWYNELSQDYVWKEVNRLYLTNYKKGELKITSKGDNKLCMQQPHKLLQFKYYFSDVNWRRGRYVTKRWHAGDVDVLNGAASAAGRHLWDACYLHSQEGSRPMIIAGRDRHLLVYDYETSVCLYFAESYRFCPIIRVDGDKIYQWDNISTLFRVWVMPPLTGPISSRNAPKQLLNTGTLRLETTEGFSFMPIMIAPTIRGDHIFGVCGVHANAVSVWNATSGQLEYCLEGHDDAILCMDQWENYVVTGGLDLTVRIYDLMNPKRECTHVLIGHRLPIHSIRVYDNTVVSFNRKEIMMWDRSSGERRFAVDLSTFNYARNMVHKMLRVDGAVENLQRRSHFYKRVKDVSIDGDSIVVATSTESMGSYESSFANRIVVMDHYGNVTQKYETEGDTIEISKLFLLPNYKMVAVSLDRFAFYPWMATTMDFELQENGFKRGGSVSQKVVSRSRSRRRWSL